ncbi:hypothetical protein BOTBODRAFT_27915 [Botryobasidium botryosum FD-172 SS1]|uniref:Uncharacterized protein n=1 Tax=Botryobasidium botryosum (strain FD-172 SS1) TaxID=930990 RepID=A0A067MUS9_BOTB1|nr:hypothetical protein BOTBODRAFT_27915 [Botryobasidium botryosum FD-172 SS1]
MGTRGLKVYRHRARYFVHYNHWDSYPEGFGVHVLSEIPQGEAFEEWLALMRKQLDRELKEWEASGCPSRKDQKTFPDWVVEAQATSNEFDAEWIYEIDLDRLVFHIDARPAFRLDCLPPEDVFVEGISYDNYGDRCYAPSVPEEHHYDWKPAPSPVEDSVVDAYCSYARGAEAVVPVHELLSVAKGLSHVETVWTRLLEVTVGQLMCNHSLIVKELESRAHWTEMAEAERALGLVVGNAALEVGFIPGEDEDNFPGVPAEDVWWLERNMCMCLATHLDDERSMQAAIVRLRNEVMRKEAGTPDVVYGVVTSIYHLVILRVDRSMEGAVKHTPALQFFPSFYATSMSTPGIMALARLGRHVQPIEGATLLTTYHPLSQLSDQKLCKFAKRLAYSTDNPEFAKISDPTISAAELFLGYPLLGEHLLLSTIDIYPEHPQDSQSRDPRPYRHLVAGEFTTFTHGKLATLRLAPDSWSCANRGEIFVMDSFKPLGCHQMRAHFLDG